jgi:hypothetical protein
VNWWNIVTGRGSKNPWHPLAVLIPVLLYRMHELGDRWQGAFRPWVPATDAMMFTASEHSGLTADLLNTLIDLTQKQRVWSKQIRQALTAPMVSLGWIIALLAGTGLYYFPALKRSLPNMRMVGSAATLQHLTDFITTQGPFWAVPLLLVPWGVKYTLNTLTGPFRASIDSLPLFAEFRQRSGMEFLLGLSTLLQAGLTFREAAQSLCQTAKPYVRERITAILAFDDLRPADAMAATGFHWPDDTTIELLTLYMETETPETGIRIIVEDFFDKVGDDYARKASFLNMFGQLATWGLVGWLYLVTNDIISSSTAHIAH